MKVKECMCFEAVCTNENTSIAEAAKIMNENHIGYLPVCNQNNHIVGIVTDRDLILRSIASDKDIKQTPLKDIMTTKIYNVNPETELNDAINIMCNCQVRRLPVVQDNKVVGVLSVGDLARNQNVSDMEVAKTFTNICNCGCNCKNAE